MIEFENFSLPVLYLVFCAGMLLLSLGINGLLLKFSVTLGTKNEFQQVRWASTTKPASGGISFYIIFLVSIVFCSFFLASDQMMLNSRFLGIFLACTLGFLMGLADDVYNTKPFLKFAVQFICALLLVVTGTIIKVFPWEWLNITVTFLWVVGLMNSINMLDNMDGITASVSTIICAAAATILISNNDFSSIYLVILMGVIAGICGFLYYNWNPSRIYMGDSGSQFLGVFLAAMGIEYFWNAPDYFGQAVQAKQILIPALIFVVPISDTATVSINRILKGKSPFVGGKDHTTHHLSYMGLSDRHVALVMIAISLFTLAISVLVINHIRDWSHWHTVGFSALFLLILSFLYSTTRISSPSKKP